tara:strand:- start:15347 stop:16219 length:873 start_codon:yes stop_codon:yes gene_type:complete
MPELPEVEVVKRSLKKTITNLTIKNIRINNSLLRYKVNKLVLKRIIGLKIKSIERRSKYLLFFFYKSELVMIVHLGMTGKFFISKNKQQFKTSFYYNLNEKKDNKHNHIIFFFKNKNKLIYNDVRKFGFIKFDLRKKLKDNKHISLLGAEPLENKFNFTYFKTYIKGRKRLIKDILMDQKFISGLGNIYVNEILFLSKVHPFRMVKELKNYEIKLIIFNTKKILKKAIISGGSSIKNFSSLSGKSGNFQQFFQVYGKEGENCSNFDCNDLIQKKAISNRASFFCSNCQKY